MRSADGDIVGIRTRHRRGQKRALTGSRAGVFMADDLHGRGPILVVEGPTCAAAALTLGFDVVGKPSAQGGNEIVEQVIVGRDVVVIGERDVTGVREAAKLARRLLRVASSVRAIFAPRGSKDLRAALQAGTSRNELLAAIGSAPGRSIELEVGW